MKMNSKLCRFAGVVLIFCILLGIEFTACAEVYTVSDDAGSADTVYVAGNPDCFPIEYYDSESKTFCGVIPDILRKISEKTGISFTYISASSKNRQKELSRNNQAELVTAIESEHNECSVSETVPILKSSLEGNDVTYCIGFTEIASQEMIEKVKSACSEISEQEKTGLLISNATDNPNLKTDKYIIFLICSVAFVLLAIIAIIAIFAVVHKRKRNAKDSLIDNRTGVGNAEYLSYVFENLISYQSRNLYITVYLAFDTEKISVKYGEKAVDEIEKYAATHLSAAIASAEYLAKTDSGVFVLLIQAVTKKEAASKTLDILNGLNLYIQEFYPETADMFKAGISRLCEHPDGNSETEFYNARQGYFAALKSGNAVEITSTEHLSQSRKREKLRLSLPKAVSDGEFRVYMQFITENKTGKICGAEMLSRWQNSEYGILRPSEYIGLLKETGQIVEHDYKIFSALCRQLEVWDKKPFDSLFLTCNFTRISFCQNDFFDCINAISSEFKFDHSRLVIEVTEDSIAEDSAVVSENIRKCREIGFKIAIDDMGTGFSSFADLYDNEIDLVKISSEFITSCTSKRRQEMLADIISLVHRSGAKIICEGVERFEQAQILNDMDCDMIQGFYYSKILPLAECAKFLEMGNICEKSVFTAE